MHSITEGSQDFNDLYKRVINVCLVSTTMKGPLNQGPCPCLPL